MDYDGLTERDLLEDLPRPAKVRRRPTASSENWRRRSSSFFLVMLDERE